MTLLSGITKAIVTDKDRTSVHALQQGPIVSGTRFLKVLIWLSICALISLLWLFLRVPRGPGSLELAGVDLMKL